MPINGLQRLADRVASARPETGRPSTPGVAVSTTASSPRVLFVALGIYGTEGGIERVNRRVLRSLSELSGATRRTYAISLRDRATPPGSVPRGVAVARGGRSRVRTIAAFARLALVRQPDVIVYSHVLVTPLALAARILSPRSRHVLLAHGIEVWSRPGWFRTWVVRTQIDAIAAVSEFTARKMGIAYGLSPSRFRLLPGAADKARPGEGTLTALGASSDPHPLYRFGPGTRGSRNTAADPPHAARHVLTVARLERGAAHKNVDKVIQALPAVLESCPDTRYVIVGDGNLRPELERLATSLGVRHAVDFVGSASDAERDALYDSASVFILPSTGEGFGLVYLEAWQHGLPVVCADTGASRELIEDGVTGLRIRPDPAAIAGALIELLGNTSRAAAMGERGRALVARRYSHAHFRDRLRTILAEQASAR